MSNKLLVTGAAGHLGRLVIHHLLETKKVPAASIIATSRNPGKLSELADRGVEVRKADFDDEASLTHAFAGADRLLIISTDELSVPGKRLVQHEAAVRAAGKAGVRHILYTSMPSPEDAAVLFAPDHLGTEQAIKKSGIPYTIFRNGWYMENLFMALPHALADGKWYSAAGEGRIAHIARDDCALAIASALASGAIESVTYTLTGPTAYTTDEVAALVSEVSGKPLQVMHVTDEQLAAGKKAAGVPEGFVPILVSFDTNTRVGKIDMVTADAEKWAGRPLVGLKAFFEANRQALGA
ncbi:SDR family oxidoreductase [Rhizobiaceae bacterium n13]|uniref:SDR family oxidoreductase n=1 Tax=Ferirhizobium litorale TaxID=2927786 RepID=A0AAE3QGA1_9HYPH|nr:SDR family oxidoreductase [Fererhizobium litorale]MDI7863667.1 SDR family oxidoreductase [Fererhizobium litorale]MDI7923363.1 SDR family oxidoreductase [Fererhizobium litorale]